MSKRLFRHNGNAGANGPGAFSGPRSDRLQSCPPELVDAKDGPGYSESAPEPSETLPFSSMALTMCHAATAMAKMTPK